jgi:hypothetical protein
MLWTIFVILCALWLLALFSGTTAGGLIHVLLGYRHRCDAGQSYSGT